MIKNIIFDMGKVLLHFDHAAFLGRHELSVDDKALLRREVFLSTEWVQMDRGTLDEPEAEKLMCARLPQRLHGCVHALVSCWDAPLMPMEGMYELVDELKQAGYEIYLLSNASHRQHEYWPRLPVSRFFRDTLISADVGVMKPHPDIYRIALEKFGLNADECIFIDDSPANIECGNHCGIPGIVFHGDAALLRRSLREAGVRI